MKTTELALALILCASGAYAAPMEAAEANVVLPAQARTALTRLPILMQGLDLNVMQMHRMEDLSARMSVAGAPVSRQDMAEYAQLARGFAQKLVKDQSNAPVVAAAFAQAAEAARPYLSVHDSEAFLVSAEFVAGEYHGQVMKHAHEMAAQLTKQHTDEPVENLPAPEIQSEVVPAHSYLESSSKLKIKGYDHWVNVPEYTRYFAMIDGQKVGIGGSADWIKSRVKVGARELWLTAAGVSELVKNGENISLNSILAIEDATIEGPGGPTVAEIPSRVTNVLLKLETARRTFWITNAGPYEVVGSKKSETGFALKRLNFDGTRYSWIKEAAPYAALAVIVGGVPFVGIDAWGSFLLAAAIIGMFAFIAGVGLVAVGATILEGAQWAIKRFTRPDPKRDANWAILKSYYEKQSQLGWAETKSLLSGLQTGPSNYQVVKDRILSASLEKLPGVLLPTDQAVMQAVEIAGQFSTPNDTNNAILGFFYRAKSRLDRDGISVLLDSLRMDASNAAVVRARILK